MCLGSPKRKGTDSRDHRVRTEAIISTIGYILIVVLLFYASSIAFVASRYFRPSFTLTTLNVGLVLVGGYLAIRLVSIILVKVAEPSIGLTRTRGIKNFFQIVAGIVLLVVAFGIYGVNITNVLIGAGFLGIVLGLAAQQVLGNVFAGVTLFISRPFEIGDRLTIANGSYSLLGSTFPRENQINGMTGVVQDIGIFFTRVLLDEGIPSVFPNSVIIGSLVVNHSRVILRRVRVRIDLDKELEFETFKSRMLESMKKNEKVEGERCSVEVVDVALKTYQVAVTIWSRETYEEPIKTIVIREALKIQGELAKSSEVRRRDGQDAGF